MSTTLNKTEGQNQPQEIMNPDIEIEEYRTSIELFCEVAQQARSLSEVSELIEEILRVTQWILRASASLLLLIDKQQNRFYLQAAGLTAQTY